MRKSKPNVSSRHDRCEYRETDHALRRPSFLIAVAAAVAIAIATPSPQALAQTCTPAGSGLVAWWPLEGNTNDIVSSPQPYNGTLFNSSYIAGIRGQALFFNGVNSYVEVPARGGPGPHLLRTEFTIEFWANSSGVADRPTFGYAHSGGAADIPAITSYDSFLVFGNLVAASKQNLPALPLAPANTWTHYAIVDDGSFYRVYVNGVESYNAAITVNTLVNPSNPFVIGKSGSAQPVDEDYYSGRLDEFTIYSRGLSAVEIAALHAAGSAGKCVACGNSAIQSGEACDDGNLTSGDGCDSNCTVTACGNAIVSPGEDCEDGNVANGDCCSSSCHYDANGSSCGDEGNVCTDNLCNGAGTCTHPNNTASCSDGVFCNGADTCSGGLCGVHAGDPCGAGGECADSCNETADNCLDAAATPCTDDGNVCSDDQCNGAGACVHPANTAPCDDSTFCNGVDTCAGGSCVHAGDPCSGGGECADSCNESVDNCLVAAATPCGDDGNVCSDDECNGAGACVHPANTASCEDGAFCNGADSCSGGSCVHAGDPCSGGGECADSCNESVDNCLVAAATPCGDDGNVCSDDECNGAGACVHPANSDSCDDGAFCNGADTCAGGSCSVHAGDPCSGGGQCADSCNETADNCLDADGTPCDDAAACTIDDQCSAGACSGSSMTCGDATVQGGCNEECDDGGIADDDGCDATCHVEPCAPDPDPSCKSPFVAGKASIKVKYSDDPTRNSLKWNWTAGSATDVLDFGYPVAIDDYWLCVYDAGELAMTTRIPAGGLCDGDPCWVAKPRSFQFRADTPTEDGATQLKVQAGDDGRAKASLKASGQNLQVTDLEALGGPVVVQLVKSTGGACWTTTFSPPFAKQDAASFADRAD